VFSGILFPNCSSICSLKNVGKITNDPWFVRSRFDSVVPDARINWSDVWGGAMLTAILFTAGKSATALYLGHSDIGSAFGAAGSILATLPGYFIPHKFSSSALSLQKSTQSSGA